MFLHENISLTAGKKWLAEDHEVSISLSSMHSWFQRVVWPLKLEMRKQRATMANALISEAQGKDVNWTEALKEEVGQQAYEMMTMGMNKKEALAYAKTAFAEEKEAHDQKMAKVKLEQSQEKLEQDERRLKLLEEKARKADRVEALLKERQANGGGMNEETLLKIERELGMLS